MFHSSSYTYYFYFKNFELAIKLEVYSLTYNICKFIVIKVKEM